MPETSIPPPPVVTRPSRPVSETLLNEKVRLYRSPWAHSKIYLANAKFMEFVLTSCDSGTAASRLFSSARPSACPSASSSPSSSSSAARGLHSSAWALVPEGRTRSATRALSERERAQLGHKRYDRTAAAALIERAPSCSTAQLTYWP